MLFPNHCRKNSITMIIRENGIVVSDQKCKGTEGASAERFYSTVGVENVTKASKRYDDFMAEQ